MGLRYSDRSHLLFRFQTRQVGSSIVVGHERSEADDVLSVLRPTCASQFKRVDTP
jgi:hypothetical protein